LPERLSWQRLLDLDRSCSVATAPDERRTPVRLPFGLIDLPAEQRQEVLAWRLDGSHLAVGGGPRSGRSTTLRTLARAVGRISEEVHVYVLDGAGALAELREVPHLEAVIPVHDTERAERLLKLLAAEIVARQGSAESTWHGPRFTAERLGDEQGEPEQPGEQEVHAGVVLLIDGWEALTSAWGAVDHGRLIDQLFGILRDGPAVGLHAAISGSRTLLTGAISSLLSERVLLRFADPADAVLAGVPSSQVLKSPPAGRGLLLGPRFPEAIEIQVALDQADPEAQPSGQEAPLGQQAAFDQQAPLGQQAEQWPRSRPPAGRRSWRIPELPRRLEHRQLINIWERQVLTGEAEAAPGSICVPVGIGGDEALALTLDLTLATVALVVGPNGSGRTNALYCLADGLVRLGEPVLWVSFNGRGFNGRDLNRRNLNRRGYNSCGSGSVDDRDSPLIGRSSSSAGSPDSGLAEVPMVAAGRPDAASSLASLLAARPNSTVLVDDTQSPGTADSLRGALEDQLTAHLGLGRMILACSAAEVLGAYRGLLSAARTARSGLLLNPSGPGDAEVFGLRPERRPPGPPGRALLVEDGRATTVQLALTPALDLIPADELPPALEATPAVEFHRPQLEQHQPQHRPAATNGMKATNGIRAPTRRPLEGEADRAWRNPPPRGGSTPERQSDEKVNT
jgi:S-DNA-T family DNA segregation ATPase FtsK/SpoIIIE